MRKFGVVIIGCVFLILCFSSAVFAYPVTINFDDLVHPSGDPTEAILITDQYADLGVLFSSQYFSHTDYFPGIEHPGYGGYYGLDGITFQTYCAAAAFFQMDFSVPVNYVSVELQPFEAGDFVFGLALYDESDTLINETTMNMTTTGSIWGGGIDPSEMVFLEAMSPDFDVAYAKFYGYYGGLGGVNAVSADNITINKVPEPSTLLLIGTGLVGIGIFRRKFKG